MCSLHRGPACPPVGGISVVTVSGDLTALAILTAAGHRRPRRLRRPSRRCAARRGPSWPASWRGCYPPGTGRRDSSSAPRFACHSRRGRPLRRGLGRAHRRPHRAVGTRGETAEHPRVALVGGVGEVVADERGDFVRGPRVDGGAILDIRAVVRLLVDAQGRDDDDGGRDDPGVDGVVEGLLDVGTLRGAVGLARVPVQQGSMTA